MYEWEWEWWESGIKLLVIKMLNVNVLWKEFIIDGEIQNTRKLKKKRNQISNMLIEISNVKLKF